MPKRVPSYRLHRPTGQAFIEIRGRRMYLGKHGTAASRRRYAQVLAELLAGQTQPVSAWTRSGQQSPTTIDVLIREFWEHVKVRYVKHGQPTSERNRFKIALKAVRELYRGLPADEFGPLRLVAVRKVFIDRGYCRSQINLLIGRIRRCWKWGVSRELVAETTWRALLSVEGLRKGEAHDLPPVRPVDASQIEAVKPFLSPVINAMIQFQLLTGCRPGEVCAIKMKDLKMQGDVWQYVPGSHKTEHHGIQRIIQVGPKAQAVLRPFLKADPDASLFRPIESREWYLAKTRKRSRRKVGKPIRKAGEHYTTNSYGQAIREACQRAKIDVWAPNQLRHSTGTLVRSLFGLEVSRTVLGHRSAVTTEIYAEEDAGKARQAMREIG